MLGLSVPPSLLAIADEVIEKSVTEATNLMQFRYNSWSSVRKAMSSGAKACKPNDAVGLRRAADLDESGGATVDSASWAATLPAISSLPRF